MIRLFQGIDLVPVAKLRKIMLARESFAEEIFTAREREYCLARPDPYLHFAGRFAAKEACLKALGAGMAGMGIDAALAEIEVVPDRSGKPVLALSGWTEKMSKKKKIEQHTISISHSGGFAVASVILTGTDPGTEMKRG